MERNINDTYRIQSDSFLSGSYLSSLTMLYQPLLGANAYTLYLTLYAQAAMGQSLSHEQLLVMLDTILPDFEKALVRLESYLLVKTFVKETDRTYVYRLNPPLTPDVFLAQKEWVYDWIKEIGEDTARRIGAMYQKPIVMKGYTDVTHPVIQSHHIYDEDKEMLFAKPEPRYLFGNKEENINFNYDRFLTITDILVFPAELRTREHLKLIGQLATVYGLTPDRMNILVSHAINPEKMTFDEEKLRLLASRTQPDITDAKDMYDLPPVSFLQAKQNGAPVSMTDRKIIEHLCVNMKFPPDVVNIMLEYILKSSDNRLVKSFVDSVAGEWARDGVDDREKAFAETKKRVSYATSGAKRSTKQMPAFYEKTQERYEKASADEIAAVEALMKKMEG